MLVPSGGHRGYGLALVLEILTGVLAGGTRFAPRVSGPSALSTPQGVSVFLLAIDPAVSMPYEQFLDRVDALIDTIHSSSPAPGVERVYIPGERGFLTAERREREGVPMSGKTIRQLRTLASELGVSATI